MEGEGEREGGCMESINVTLHPEREEREEREEKEEREEREEKGGEGRGKEVAKGSFTKGFEWSNTWKCSAT